MAFESALLNDFEGQQDLRKLQHNDNMLDDMLETYGVE